MVSKCRGEGLVQERGNLTAIAEVKEKKRDKDVEENNR